MWNVIEHSFKLTLHYSVIPTSSSGGCHGKHSVMFPPCQRRNSHLFIKGVAIRHDSALLVHDIVMSSRRNPALSTKDVAITVLTHQGCCRIYQRRKYTPPTLGRLPHNPPHLTWDLIGHNPTKFILEVGPNVPSYVWDTSNTSTPFCHGGNQTHLHRVDNITKHTQSIWGGHIAPKLCALVPITFSGTKVKNKQNIGPFLGLKDSVYLEPIPPK